MDPVSARFAQLFIAEGLGAVLCVGGLVLLFLGAAGKISVFMKGAGAQARLTNASPGLVVAIIGVVLVWLSLRGQVQREETHDGSTTATVLGPVQQDEIVKTWVARAAGLQKSTDHLNYSRVTDEIVGKEPVRRFVSAMQRLPETKTLAQIAETEYGHRDYWPLIAAINLDRGYYQFPSANDATPIKKDSYIEIWKVSGHYGEDSKTRVQISGPAVRAANEELLTLAEANAPLDIPALQDRYKAKELDLLYGEANIGDTRNLRELSIKYYGNARFWTIIRWSNMAVLKNATADTNIVGQRDLYVLHFLVP
jgi:hypothetical protein